MTNSSLAHPAHPSTTDLEHVSGIAARVLRGQELYRYHAAEIRYENGTWFVPSRTDGTSVYEVHLSRNGESCECKDFEHHRGGRCLHIYAATIAKAKSAPCSRCGQRHRHRDLTEVGEDSLTFFEGDKLCRVCADDHGVV